jgi:hypothetical protein
MGLGSVQDVSLAEARQQAAECRKLRQDDFMTVNGFAIAAAQARS